MTYTVQGKYPPYGWEDLTSEESYEEALKRRKEYEDNEKGQYRIIPTKDDES